MTRTAKSARRLIALTLLSALAISGAAGVTLYGAASKAPFTVAATPSTQSVTQGQTATYGVSLARENKFTSPVTMSVNGLPGAATATFTPNPIPGSGSSSSLAVKTNTTLPGTYSFTITGTSGGSSSSKSLTLTVLSGEQANFSLAGAPASRVISDDDSVSYSIGIARNGFNGQVDLSVGGLPKDFTGVFLPDPASGSGSTLTITSPVKPKAGTYTLTIFGTGQDGANTITRSATVTLVVEEKKPFQISGAAPTGLRPGESAPVDLVLANPHNFPLQITDLHVSVDRTTSAPGCDGEENFSTEQIPAARYPFVLPTGSPRSLDDLGIADADKPAVTMNNLPSNQDACKSVSFNLHYTGTATR